MLLTTTTGAPRTALGVDSRVAPVVVPSRRAAPVDDGAIAVAIVVDDVARRPGKRPGVGDAPPAAAADVVVIVDVGARPTLSGVWPLARFAVLGGVGVAAFVVVVVVVAVVVVLAARPATAM